MPVHLLNPEGLFQPDSYFQAAIAIGTRTIHLSGQPALDEAGHLVGKDDLSAQAEQAYRNVTVALRGIGADFGDVAKLTVYVVDWSPEKMKQLEEGAMRAGKSLGFDPRRPVTLIGVTALAAPDFLIEVEAVAVLA